MSIDLATVATQERWRLTPLNRILDKTWHTPSGQHSLPKHQLEVLPEQAIIIPIINGGIDHQWFDSQRLPAGLLLSSHTDSYEDILTLCVIKDTQLERPIVLLHVVTEQLKPVEVRSRIKIILEEKAHAHFLWIERGQNDYVAYPEVSISIAQTAKCDWVRCAINADTGHSFYSMQVQQQADSQLNLLNYQSTGQLVRTDLTIDVLGENTLTNLSGINIAGQTQHVSQVITLNHQVPHGTSSQRFKNILADQATGLFDGQIHVFPQAQKTDAAQLTNALLISPKARSLIVPRLEIYADDVKCSHGATIGFLSPDQVFYLRTRGFNQAEAEQMLMQAFVQELVEEVEHPAIQNWLSPLVTECLANLKR